MARASMRRSLRFDTRYDEHERSQGAKLISPQFSDLLEQRDATVVPSLSESSDLIAEIGSSGSEIADSAQTKASSVMNEASSVISQATNAIPKPTLLANMTAEKACLEVLSLTECYPTHIDSAFLAAFWILMFGATLTAAIFFTCKSVGKNYWKWHITKWITIIFCLLATALFLGLTIIAWTVHRVVHSGRGDKDASENAQSIYLTFTSIAVISVISWVIVQQHKVRTSSCADCQKEYEGTSRAPPLAGDSMRKTCIERSGHIPIDMSLTHPAQRHNGPEIHHDSPTVPVKAAERGHASRFKEGVDLRSN